MNVPVLLVDDDVAIRDSLAQTLDLAGFTAITRGSFVAAKDHITPQFPGVILSDIRMPGRDGFHLLAYARDVDDALPVVLLTGEGDIPMAVSAMEQGAFDFLEKPCAPGDLVAVLNRAVAVRIAALEARADLARREASDPAARLIFGVSDLARELRVKIRLVAGVDTEVLVTGPPGSGISKIAEVIHLCSSRAQGPFEKRAAAGLDRGALKHALDASIGGSLFIDEVTQMSADTQLALSESLDAGCKVRLLAGSTAVLHEGQVTADLFYRLQVMTVRIPSLSERPEDIAVLFRQYVGQASEQAGLRAPEITPEVIAGLMAQDWPGNARGLMSDAMRFALGLQDLGLQDDVGDSREMGLTERMAQVEQSLLEAALRRSGGQASEAAKALKLPRKTFYDKLARYGIRPEAFRG